MFSAIAPFYVIVINIRLLDPKFLLFQLLFEYIGAYLQLKSAAHHEYISRYEYSPDDGFGVG